MQRDTRAASFTRSLLLSGGKLYISELPHNQILTVVLILFDILTLADEPFAICLILSL